MNEFALIADLALIWGVALVVGYICIRLKQPVIAGYMLAGVVLGPHGLKLISRADHIGFLSEFGVAMMLFALGVDLSLKQVLSSAKRIVSAGLVQMLLTITAAACLSYFFHVATSVSSAILFGCICAISSSVVISRLLVDRGESDSIHGQILLPLSLVQDLALVAIIPFMPILQNGQADPMLILFSFLKAAGFILAVIVGSIKIVPYVLSKAANSNSREIFMLTILVLCLGVALLSEKAGLSIALGAFLAGIMMSESTYAHQALHDVSPLKDVFSTIFFVSVGLLLDPIFVFQHAMEVLCFVIILILGKALIGTLAALLATKNLRSAIFVGAGLAQIGEFSFVLLTLGHDSKIVSEAIYNLLLAGSVLTMMLSPALMALVPKLLVRRMAKASDFHSADPNAQQSGL
ncbi:MAG: cation:proton antiporter, partial [Candidatus Obscuribacterales bacterium]|nr:cation:proton antiporter [Candidatus Obscuribacterales bacterium]